MSADAEEFTAYVAAHSRSLLRTAYLLTGNDRDAEDLVQAALLRTLKHWKRIRQREALDAFVRQVMVNERRAGLRRKLSREQVRADLPEATAGDPTNDVDELDRLRRALLQLPMRQRAAVVLRYYEDRSEADTATILRCSVGNVKSLASRGLAKLRAVIDDSEGMNHELPRR